MASPISSAMAFSRFCRTETVMGSVMRWMVAGWGWRGKTGGADWRASLRHPMGYAILKDAEAHDRHQRSGLELPQPLGSELRADRAGQKTEGSDAGDAPIISGV